MVLLVQRSFHGEDVRDPTPYSQLQLLLVNNGHGRTTFRQPYCLRNLSDPLTPLMGNQSHKVCHG